MERRTHERLFAELPARLFYGNIVYTGTVRDLSESGMFISTRLYFPVDSVFLVVIQQNGQSFKMNIKVKRIARPSGGNLTREQSGIGVRLIEPSQMYLEFIQKCREGSAAVH